MAALFFVLGVVSALAGAVTYRFLLPPAYPDPAAFLELFRTMYGDRAEPANSASIELERAAVQAELARLEEMALIPSARGEHWVDPTAQFVPDQHEAGAIIPPGMTWQEFNGMGTVGDDLGGSNGAR